MAILRFYGFHLCRSFFDRVGKVKHFVELAAVRISSSFPRAAKSLLLFFGEFLLLYPIDYHFFFRHGLRYRGYFLSLLDSCPFLIYVNALFRSFGFVADFQVDALDVVCPLFMIEVEVTPCLFALWQESPCWDFVVMSFPACCRVRLAELKSRVISRLGFRRSTWKEHSSYCLSGFHLFIQETCELILVVRHVEKSRDQILDFIERCGVCISVGCRPRFC